MTVQFNTIRGFGIPGLRPRAQQVRWQVLKWQHFSQENFIKLLN